MFIKNNFKLSVLFIALFISDISTAQPVTTVPPALFSDADTAKPTQDAGRISPAAMKFRYARLNIEVLFDSKGQFRGSNQIPKLRFNLFPNANFIGTVNSEVDQQMGMTGWGGTIYPPGSFSLVASKEEGGASMTLSAGLRVFHVSCDRAFVCIITEEDTAKYPPP